MSLFSGITVQKSTSNPSVNYATACYRPSSIAKTFKEAVSSLLDYGLRNTSRGSTRLTSRYDGAGSDEGRMLAVSTLPRINHRSKTFRRRPSLKTFESESSLRSTGSIRALDRFVPRRATLDSATECYQISKDPKTLSTDEKLFRNKVVSQDAFNPRRRVTSPIPRANRHIQRRNFSGNRSGSGGGSVLTFQRDPADANGERQVSVGTVWRVGGLAPVSGVSDGRGGLYGSGTNAPLYTTSFSARPKTQENIDRHEGRLAEALNIDRTLRVLECRDTSLPKSSTIGHRYGELGKTIWSGTQWLMGDPNNKAPMTEEARNLPTAPFK